jgi:hypothetical protein
VSVLCADGGRPQGIELEARRYNEFPLCLGALVVKKRVGNPKTSRLGSEMGGFCRKSWMPSG